ncbi:unknown [Prevotella sp. CAG:924]|nr:unknown [Prevotella sp. CAG:924]
MLRFRHFVVCACGKAVEFASDDTFEGLVSLGDGFYPFFAVHLYANVPVDTSFVPHFPDEEGVLEYFALDAFFPDAPFLKVVTVVGFQLVQVELQFILVQ